MTVFDDEDEEGIHVFCTDKRSRVVTVTSCTTFLGGAKNCNFCLINFSYGPAPMDTKSSTICYILSSHA